MIAQLVIGLVDPLSEHCEWLLRVDGKWHMARGLYMRVNVKKLNPTSENMIKDLNI